MPGYPTVDCALRTPFVFIGLIALWPYNLGNLKRNSYLQSVVNFVTFLIVE